MLRVLSRWIFSAYSAAAFATLIVLTGWIAREVLRYPSRNEASEAKPTLGHEGLFAFLLLAVLLAWRWPDLLIRHDFNPDESQFIASAITLARHSLYWKSVDIHTSGPLDVYALLPLHWLGLPFNFFSARLTLLLLLTGTLLGIYYALRPFCGASLARIACLPAILFFAFATYPDFLAYSSETAPDFLLALSAALAARVYVQTSQGAISRTSLCGLGLALGLMPWAKLQAIPLAACLGGIVLVMIFAAPFPRREKLRAGFYFLAAVATPSFIALASIVASQQWQHFYNSSIAYNYFYTSKGMPLATTLRAIGSHLIDFENFGALSIFVFTALAAAAVGTPRRWLTGFALTLAAALAVVLPGRDFPHYLLLLIVPLSLWAGLSLGLFREKFASGSAKAKCTTLIFIILAFSVPPVWWRMWKRPPDLAAILNGWHAPASPIARGVLALARPDDCLCVWGWDPQLYVETGLPQATRDPHVQRQLEDSPLRDYYRRRFLDELKQSQPAIFVDAVRPSGFAFHDRAAAGHETFPELRALVSERYILKEEIDGARIYLRKDRAAPGPP